MIEILVIHKFNIGLKLTNKARITLKKGWFSVFEIVEISRHGSFKENDSELKLKILKTKIPHTQAPQHRC